MSDLSSLIKEIVEKVQPDLRKSLRLELQGVVKEVHDDEGDDYYTVDVEVADVTYKNVPVNSLWACDGYGVWALPCVDSDVIVSFAGLDNPVPYISSSLYYPNNKAPEDMKAGMLAFVGKEGQKFRLDDSESLIEIIADKQHVISKDSYIKMETDREDKTGGDYEHNITGNSETVANGSINNEAKSGHTIEGSSIKIGKGASQAVILGTLWLNVLIPILQASTDTYGKPTMPGANALVADTFLSQKATVE